MLPHGASSWSPKDMCNLLPLKLLGHLSPGFVDKHGLEGLGLRPTLGSHPLLQVCDLGRVVSSLGTASSAASRCTGLGHHCHAFRVFIYSVSSERCVEKA